MNNETFKQIIENIDHICSEIIENAEQVKQISLSIIFSVPLEELKTQACSLQSVTDKILHNELYHIIGMGKLSSSQLMQFCNKIKELGNVKDILKRTLTCLDNLSAIKSTLTGTASYQLTELAKIKLKGE